MHTSAAGAAASLQTSACAFHSSTKSLSGSVLDSDQPCTLTGCTSGTASELCGILEIGDDCGTLCGLFPAICGLSTFFSLTYFVSSTVVFTPASYLDLTGETDLVVLLLVARRSQLPPILFSCCFVVLLPSPCNDLPSHHLYHSRRLCDTNLPIAEV